LKQSLAGRLCTKPVSATRLAPVSRQGFAVQILAEQFAHFIRELLYILNFRQIGATIRLTGALVNRRTAEQAQKDNCMSAATH
jgi:hypothetical protein